MEPRSSEAAATRRGFTAVFASIDEVNRLHGPVPRPMTVLAFKETGALWRMVPCRGPTAILVVAKASSAP